MKVCLYLEGNEILKRSGIGVALSRQKTALEKAGVEYTTDPNGDYDIIHINTIFPRSLMYAQAAKKKGRKVIMHAHTLEEDTRNSFTLSNTIAPLFKRYLSFFYKQADHIICPTPHVKKLLISEYGITKPITPVSNGVDLEKFKFSESGRKKYRERYKLDGIVPFSVGHVFMRKGVKTFIEVARDFPDNRFMWFGNVFKGGIAKNPEVEEAIRTKTPNVTFTGYIDDIFAAYSAGDIFFFPSLAETQGIVILEAWAMERPVLIRDLPVFSDWTHDGKDCLKAKDNDDFKKKLRMLMDDEGLRKRLVREGKKTVQQHSMDKIGQQLKKVYEEVLNEG
jgi:1,2-diacylglycerol-3-alpha-glucose alpha-1,2-glucosyltransferase